MTPGDVKQFTLKKGEVLNIESNQYHGEITGTEIESTAPVAVFSGTECSNIPDTTTCENGFC
jgi:hypothetical protein